MGSLGCFVLLFDLELCLLTDCVLLFWFVWVCLLDYLYFRCLVCCVIDFGFASVGRVCCDFGLWAELIMCLFEFS